jgi:hypothetical protein
MGNMRSNRPLPLIFCRYCANWRRRQHDGLAAFSQTRLPVSRWRNGGGETREIISWPPGQRILTGVPALPLSRRMARFPLSPALRVPSRC